MKQLMVFLGFVLLLFGGCQKVSQNKSDIDVTVEGGGEFPKSLAGTWKCEWAGLEIGFKPDGTISSAVIPIGMPRMGPNETIEFNNPETGGKGFFQTGPMLTYYTPSKRELTAKLYLKRYRIELEDGGVIEGNSEDIFTGKVSEDGKEWKADWFEFPEYYITAEAYKNFEIPFDPNESFQDTLIFQKAASPEGK
jgi:hypothetical protein